MENFAYLHLAFDADDPDFDDSLVWNSLLDRSWDLGLTKFSSRAWQHLLPLALIFTIMSTYGSAIALEKGDRGPSVRRLQEKLRSIGFYQAPITQVYDIPTETAVRKFQKAAGIQQNGIFGSTTEAKLKNWQVPRVANGRDRGVVVPTTNQVKPPSRPKATNVANRPSTKPALNPNFIRRGDEGERVRILQERLRVAGFYYGNSTGIFGPITEEAVKRFQKAYKLQPDGIVGPLTSKVLPPLGVGYGEDVAPRRNRDRDILKQGDRGEAVRVLQAQLIQAGYLQGKPNGYFGPYTADAIRRFQSANYLKSSGIAGPTTRAKLYDLITAESKKGEFSVLEIQRRLRERGFYKGSLNGVMGNDTKKAIRLAQDFYGISLSDVRRGNF